MSQSHPHNPSVIKTFVLDILIRLLLRYCPAKLRFFFKTTRIRVSYKIKILSATKLSKGFKSTPVGSRTPIDGTGIHYSIH